MKDESIDFNDRFIPSPIQLSDPEDDKKKKRLAEERKRLMAEQAMDARRKYIGLKFNAVSEGDAVPFENEMIHLAAWARELETMGFMPYYTVEGKQYPAGNLSFRSGSGFVITPTAFNFRELKQDDLVKVLECDSATNSVKFLGKHFPSSETFLHCFIYGTRPDVFSIFYVYDVEVVRAAGHLNLPQTAEEHPYGTLELASSVIKVLDPYTDLIVVKNFAVVSLGKSIEEAGQRILKLRSERI